MFSSQTLNKSVELGEPYFLNKDRIDHTKSFLLSRFEVKSLSWSLNEWFLSDEIFMDNFHQGIIFGRKAYSWCSSIKKPHCQQSMLLLCDATTHNSIGHNMNNNNDDHRDQWHQKSFYFQILQVTLRYVSIGSYNTLIHCLSGSIIICIVPNSWTATFN